MLQKARQPKHGGYKNILERWHNDDKYREFLSKIGWAEDQIIQHDELALEDHSYIARRRERDRNEKSWVLKLHKESAQGPMNQRPGFVAAKREMERLHDEHVKEEEIHPFILYIDQDSEGANNSKDLKNTSQIDVQTRWTTYPSKSQGDLSRNPTHSSSSTQWLEFLAILILGWTVVFFFRSGMLLSLARK